MPQPDRLELLEGRASLPTVGVVQQRGSAALPYVVLDRGGEEVGVISAYLQELALSDASPLTVRSYAHDLLRWWRVLDALEVGWDRATAAEVEVLVGWMRTAPNSQRRATASLSPAAHARTGKLPLAARYAPASINHSLSVIASFYGFHARFGQGLCLTRCPRVRRVVPGWRTAVRWSRLLRIAGPRCGSGRNAWRRGRSPTTWLTS